MGLYTEVRCLSIALLLLVTCQRHTGFTQRPWTLTIDRSHRWPSPQKSEESLVQHSPPTFSNRSSWNKISIFQRPRQDWHKAQWADVTLGKVHPPWCCSFSQFPLPRMPEMPASHQKKRLVAREGWFNSSSYSEYSHVFLVSSCSGQPLLLDTTCKFLHHGTRLTD